MVESYYCTVYIIFKTIISEISQIKQILFWCNSSHGFKGKVLYSGGLDDTKNKIYCSVIIVFSIVLLCLLMFSFVV